MGNVWRVCGFSFRSGAVATLIPRASISGSTPAAGDYTDTITVVGAGVF